MPKLRSVAEIAFKWGISERSVRNYCALGRVEGAVLIGKIWKIPADADKPKRLNAKSCLPSLLEILQQERKSQTSGGIYHRIQIDLTYNSNHMEGSRLTHDQTRWIFETNTIAPEKDSMNVDDILETVNHFRCVDFIIEHATAALTEKLIKDLHGILKSGTSDSKKSWFAVGAYKRIPNEVGGEETSAPQEVHAAMHALLKKYHQKPKQTFEDLLAFHVIFEQIHPFQDGNGRIGRLILFKECLKYGITPFILHEDLKLFYYRGLQKWNNEKGYLLDTCRTAQDRFQILLNRFQIGKRK